MPRSLMIDVLATRRTRICKFLIPKREVGFDRSRTVYQAVGIECGGELLRLYRLV